MVAGVCISSSPVTRITASWRLTSSTSCVRYPYIDSDGFSTRRGESTSVTTLMRLPGFRCRACLILYEIAVGSRKSHFTGDPELATHSGILSLEIPNHFMSLWTSATERCVT